MKQKLLWLLWGLVTIVLGSYFSYIFFAAEDKTPLLIGETTHGHYQIEMACSACHGDAFSGTEGLQQACLNCHADELTLANDSHPKAKFTDPRNADRIEILDARYCITCHSEHQQETTLAMGLTIPADYCFYCHQETLEERPSHQGLDFLTCETAGCHNYHDNRALYEDFLTEHADQPDLLASPIEKSLAKPIDPTLALSQQTNDAHNEFKNTQAIEEWAASKHATVGINCSDCHLQQSSTWVQRPGMDTCEECHAFQVEGFTRGKHGMRLSSTLPMSLSPMSPGLSKQHEFSGNTKNTPQTCNTCHGSHNYDIAEAAVESCLNCHTDEHSQQFKQSPHGQQWLASSATNSNTQGVVTCATCHMPRENHQDYFRVQHNQNANLRPNEKMIRDVCMNCHGLGFSIDALADKNLIHNNFNGQPAEHIPSIDWAKDRLQQ